MKILQSSAMRIVYQTLIFITTLIPHVTAQTSIDWQAKEHALFQAVQEKNYETFANGLDKAFVGVYPSGVTNRDAQIEAVKQEEIKSFEISEFTAHNIDNRTVILSYKIEITGTSSITYWISSVWLNRDKEWRTILHTVTLPNID